MKERPEGVYVSARIHPALDSPTTVTEIIVEKVHSNHYREYMQITRMQAQDLRKLLDELDSQLTDIGAL